MRADERA
jgi:methylenetetrahydrofolate dehydrogenase (NAD+)